MNRIVKTVCSCCLLLLFCCAFSSIKASDNYKIVGEKIAKLQNNYTLIYNNGDDTETSQTIFELLQNYIESDIGCRQWFSETGYWEFISSVDYESKSVWVCYSEDDIPLAVALGVFNEDTLKFSINSIMVLDTGYDILAQALEGEGDTFDD